MGSRSHSSQIGEAGKAENGAAPGGLHDLRERLHRWGRTGIGGDLIQIGSPDLGCRRPDEPLKRRAQSCSLSAII